MTAAPEKRSSFWTLGLLLLLFVASLTLAAAATGWQETGKALARVGYWHVLALLALSLFNYSLRAVRWRILTRAMSLNTGWLQDVRHYFGGLALMATPGRVGEFVRLRWISRETGLPIDRVAPIAVAERAADLAAVALLLALAVALSAFGTRYIWLLVIVALILAWLASNAALLRYFVTLAWRMVGRWPRLFVRLRRLASGLRVFTRPSAGVPALVLGGLGWFLEGLAFGLLLNWLGAPLPLWTAVTIFLAAMTSGALAGLPGGLGGAEAAMIALLLVADVPMEIAVPATALIRTTTMWFAILLGLAVFPWAEARSMRLVETHQ